METNSEEVILLRDMNGNALRQGDLVMVLLEKPILVGFITEIKEPSIIDPKEKNAPGVVVITGTTRIPFAPRRLQILGQTVKLVDPRAEALVDAITKHVDKNATLPSVADLDAVAKEKEASEQTTGPTLVKET
jgi:hypothetical protein